MADNKVNFLRGTSAEYEASTKDNDTFYYTTDDEKLYLGDKEITGGGVTVDDALSDTSKHPVQNKVIKAAFDEKANLSDIPTSLPANGGNADTAKSVQSPTGKALLFEDNEGGNLKLVSPDGNHSVEMDLYNNTGFRIYFTDNGELTFPVDYNSTTKKFNINGNADTVDGKHADDFCKIYNHIDDSYDVNNATEPGLYRVRGGINVPSANWYDIHVTNLGGYTTQIAISDVNSMFKRNFTGVWSEWVEFAYKVDIPTSLPANGGNADTVDGKHASDFMPISGETRKYGIIRMNGSDGIYARHIDGNNSEADGALYLNYNCPDAPIYMNGNYTAIHSGNISSQSVNYANSAGSAQPIFNNATWYSVGDDVQIGDHNVVGGLGILGINGHTRIDLCQSGNPSNFKSITFDGTTLNLEGNADTVDGYHAHQLQCENEYGNPYSYSIISKWNAEGDSRFKLMEESGQYQTKVDYANSAGTANTAGISATTASNICLRNLSSGTSAANTTNCPSGAWYGKHS